MCCRVARQRPRVLGGHGCHDAVASAAGAWRAGRVHRPSDARRGRPRRPPEFRVARSGRRLGVHPADEFGQPRRRGGAPPREGELDGMAPFGGQGGSDHPPGPRRTAAPGRCSWRSTPPKPTSTPISSRCPSAVGSAPRRRRGPAAGRRHRRSASSNVLHQQDLLVGQRLWRGRRPHSGRCRRRRRPSTSWSRPTLATVSMEAAAARRAPLHHHPVHQVRARVLHQVGGEIGDRPMTRAVRPNTSCPVTRLRNSTHEACRIPRPRRGTRCNRRMRALGWWVQHRTS